MSLQLTETQRDFLNETVKILSETSPKFDYDGIAKNGRDRGLLTGAEAESLTLSGTFPTWLANGLECTALRKALPSDLLIPAWTMSLADSVSTNSQASPLLKAFVPSEVTVPAIQYSRAGQSRHYVQNFRKLAWGKDGIYSNLSDANGIVLQPFLERAEPVRLSGNALMAVVEGSVVYTHWLLDTFPRFLALIEAGISLGEFDHIVLATAAHGFHRKMLARLNIDLDRVITRQKHGNYFETDSFVHVSAPRTNFVTHPRTYDMVCEHFGQPRAPKGQTRRFFVSRAGAARRRILNEDALKEILDREGFEVIRFEDYGMEEMAALMAQASHIVAPHGAGLANLVFCRPGTKVLEIFSAHLSREYWIIAQQKGLAYYAFQANGPDGWRASRDASSGMSFFDRNGLDIHVPIEDFKDYLKGKFLS